jgi:hypothetical protein
MLDNFDSLTEQFNSSLKDFGGFIDSLRTATEYYKNIEINIKDRENSLLELSKRLEQQGDSLLKREHELATMKKKIDDDRLNFEKEIEDNRKVSIVKNLQSQLKQKSNECDILTRQVNIYKTRCEILNSLANKYNLSHDDITLDNLLECIEKSTPKKIENVEVEREQLNEEEDVLELEEFTYKGVEYYLDVNTKEVYSRLSDDEVGELVGQLDKRGRLCKSKSK